MITIDDLPEELIDEKVLLVDMESRSITIPYDVTNLGVESDDDVTRLYFAMPRYCDGTDLSEFVVRINYLNANAEGDVYEPTDVVSDEGDIITFSWIIGRHAAAYKGNVKFNVCMKSFDDYDNVIKEFNTTIASLPVLEGLETSKSITTQEYLDIYEQWRSMLFSQLNVELSNVEKKLDDKASLNKINTFTNTNVFGGEVYFNGAVAFQGYLFLARNSDNEDFNLIDRVCGIDGFLATKDDIGDVETALENIIAIQNELMGVSE